MACTGEIKISLKDWKNQLPTSNDKAEVILRITLGNRVLIEGDKLLPKLDVEESQKKGEGGELSLLIVEDNTPDPEPKERSGKSSEKKEKSGGEKGGKGKGGKGAKGQGGAGGPSSAARVWQVSQEVCLSLNKSTPCLLSDVIMHPLLISISELQPKDKKHKDEKTRLLCQTTLDLLPYVMGTAPSSSVSATPTSCAASPMPTGSTTCELVMHPCVNLEGNAYLLGVISEDKKSLLELDIVSHSDFKMTESKILTMRLRSLHSLPENLLHGSTTHTFSANFPLPISSATPSSFTLPMGMIQPSPVKDHTSIPTHWKWPSVVLSVEAAKAAKMELRPLEAESGEWQSQEHIAWREIVEGDKSRVSWNTMQRMLLSNESNTLLIAQLSRNSLLPLELGRFTMPVTGGTGSRMSKKNTDSEPVLSCHGVAYLDLAPLLYPGTCMMCGAFPVYAYKESDVRTKTGSCQPPALGSTSDTDDVNKKSGASKPSSSIPNGEMGSVEEEGAGPPGEGAKKEGGDAYEDAKTYVYLELQLDTPLIPKRTVAVLADRVKSYIPFRSTLPSYEGGVEHVVAQFQEHTSSLASKLVREYRQICKVEGKEKEGEEATDDEKQRNFMFYLTSTGKYQHIKEDLKRSVVKIVREKYLSEIPGPDDRQELQEFLSELYVFLVDQMHAGLKKAFSIVDSPPAVPSPLTSDLMKLFAFEAESAGDFELAEYYHQERVCLSSQPSCEIWYDYALFCYLTFDYDRAEQCLREAVCADISNIPAILLLGVSCCLNEEFTEAEDLFELATTSDPKNVVAWTMRGLYYEQVNNKLMQDMCFQNAIKCTEDPEHKTFLKLPSSQSLFVNKSLISAKHPSNSSKASILSGKPGLGVPSAASMQSKVMSRDMSGDIVPEGGGVKSAANGNQPGMLGVGGAGATDPALVSGASLGPPRSNQDRLGSGTGEKPGGLGERSATAIKSELNLIEDADKVEVPSIEPPPMSVAEATPTYIFLQTTVYLLDAHALKFAEMSLAHGLTSLKGDHGNSHAYLMAEARLLMYRQQHEDALKCIKQAIVVNIQDSEAWALLGHVYFLSGEEEEAIKAYERTLDYVHPPSNVHLVFIRLAQLYLQHKMYSKAKDTYLRACSHTPSALTWKGVGLACYRLGNLAEAEEALSEANILNNKDPEVWAYLAMVCILGRRTVEAEQALKFAVKTGLSDEAVLSELRELHKNNTPEVDLVHLLPPPSSPSELQA